MARGAVGDTIIVKPVNNVFTALVAVATIIVAIGLTILILRANTMGVKLFDM